MRRFVGHRATEDPRSRTGQDRGPFGAKSKFGSTQALDFACGPIKISFELAPQGFPEI